MFGLFRKGPQPSESGPPITAPPALDRSAFVEAFNVIFELDSLDAPTPAFSRYPALRDPSFHAALYAELQSKDTAPQIRAVIERFFLEIAARLYFDACDCPEPPVGALAKVQHFAPFYFQAILHHVGARTPGGKAYVLDPASDGDQILEEVRALAGSTIALPEYKILPGSRWSLISVVCAGCRKLRLQPVANMIDLTVAKQLLEPLRAGRINDFRCQDCGQIRCYPSRVWIQERPNAPDGLAALTTVVRVTDYAFAVTTPPGTIREPCNDRLHEIRSKAMFQAFPWDVPAEAGAGEMNLRLSIAYDRNQLIALIG